MLLIIVILLTAFIITPLIDLISAERVKFFLKATVYAVVFLWEFYVILVAKGAI
jgi:hypothetical protein